MGFGAWSLVWFLGSGSAVEWIGQGMLRSVVMMSEVTDEDWESRNRPSQPSQPTAPGNTTTSQDQSSKSHRQVIRLPLRRPHHQSTLARGSHRPVPNHPHHPSPAGHPSQQREQTFQFKIEVTFFISSYRQLCEMASPVNHGTQFAISSKCHSFPILC